MVYVKKFIVQLFNLILIFGFVSSVSYAEDNNALHITILTDNQNLTIIDYVLLKTVENFPDYDGNYSIKLESSNGKNLYSTKVNLPFFHFEDPQEDIIIETDDEELFSGGEKVPVEGQIHGYFPENRKRSYILPYHTNAVSIKLVDIFGNEISSYDISNFSSNKKRSYYGTNLIYYFLVGLIIATLVFFIYKNKDKFKKKPISNTEIQLKNFIDEARKQGQSDEEIRQGLIQSGWSKELIDENL